MARIKNQVNRVIPDVQVKFRAGCRTRYQIVNARLIAEKAREFGQPLHVLHRLQEGIRYGVIQLTLDQHRWEEFSISRNRPDFEFAQKTAVSGQVNGRHDEMVQDRKRCETRLHTVTLFV